MIPSTTTNQQLEQLNNGQGNATYANYNGNVDGTTGVNGPIDLTGDASLNPYGLLTPDALMTYCEARMSNLDKQAETIFNDQQKNQRLQGGFNNLLATINQYPSGFGVDGGTPDGSDQAKAQATLDQLNAAYDAAIAQVAVDNPTLAAKLTADKNGILNKGNDWHVSQSEIESMVANIKGDLGDLNSGSEMNMIQLQSLMSQRQTAIQLCTNLVQAIGEGPKEIAANMGK